VPRNWEEHYATAGLDLDPAPLLVEVADRLPPGRALDLACGSGRHALYLARGGSDFLIGGSFLSGRRGEAAIRGRPSGVVGG